jgi:hypothetical protein
MFGIQAWFIVAVLLTVGVVLFAWLRLQGRSWVYKALAALGILCLIWGVLPTFGGGKMNQYLVIGAVIAFGFLVLSDSAGDGSRW